MAQEINQKQIKNNSLTGADLDYRLGVYDETHPYSIGDKVFFATKIYRAKVNITPTQEGDLSQNPSVSSNWEIVLEDAVNIKYDDTISQIGETNVQKAIEKAFKVNYNVDGGKANTNYGGILAIQGGNANSF